MTHLGTRPLYVRSQVPAARDAKRPNGHKVQLALKREIEGLSNQLDRQKKAAQAAQEAADALEDQLFKLEADRDRCKRRLREHEKFVEKIEILLGLPSDEGSQEDREARLFDVISQLQAHSE